MELLWDEWILQECREEFHFRNLTGRENWKRYLLRNPEKTGMFLFFGETGMGKKTFIRAAAEELRDQGYNVIRLYAQDLSDKKKKTVKQKIELLYQRMTEGKKVLLLYSVDKLKNKKSAGMLAFGLEQIQRNAKDTVVLATAEDISRIPERLLGLFSVCPFLPLEGAERVAFLQRLLLPCSWDSTQIDASWIAELTAGMNCRRLERTASFARNYLFLQALEDGRHSEAEIEAQIEEGTLQITKDCLIRAAEEAQYIEYRPSGFYAEAAQADGILQPASEKETAPPPAEAEPYWKPPLKGSEGMERLTDSQQIDDSLGEAYRIMRQKDPSEEELDEMLKANGTYENKIVL